MKIQISMNDEVIERVDQYAKEHYMSRSGVLTMAAIQLINQDDLMKALKSMTISMERIADKGGVDQDILNDLEKWKSILQVYTNQ